jgi:hypothetical protein
MHGIGHNDSGASVFRVTSSKRTLVGLLDRDDEGTKTFRNVGT